MDTRQLSNFQPQRGWLAPPRVAAQFSRYPGIIRKIIVTTPTGLPTIEAPSVFVGALDESSFLSQVEEKTSLQPLQGCGKCVIVYPRVAAQLRGNPGLSSGNCVAFEEPDQRPAKTAPL